MTRVAACLPMPIVCAAAMRAHEAAAFVAGTDAYALMERAGVLAARAVRAFAGPVPTLVLCGPGNNGGDGYVLARALRDAGWPVRVAALAAPATPSAGRAAQLWGGPVEPFTGCAPARLLVDALFGIGLARPFARETADRLDALMRGADTRVAIDVPSGVDSDSGDRVGAGDVAFDLTVTFAALKPAHVLHPAAARCGRVVIADIGIGSPASSVCRAPEPILPLPERDTHKYRRGHVLVLGGDYAGAARLAAHAAQAAGAGYVTLAASHATLAAQAAHLTAVVLREADAPAAVAALAGSERVSAQVVGPGLGRDAAARARAEAALAAGVPCVVDADLFSLFAGDAEALASQLPPGCVLTPHDGECARLFGDIAGNPIERAQQAAARARQVVLLKGPASVIAAPDGRAHVLTDAPWWLATAGSGDVLAGLVAALLARGLAAFDAASAGAWLHAAAARRCGHSMTAETLLTALAAEMAER